MSKAKIDHTRNFYRSKYNRVMVQFWDKKEKRQRKIPRGHLTHLDNLTDDQIQAWVSKHIEENYSQEEEDYFLGFNTIKTYFTNYVSHKQILGQMEEATAKDATSQFFNYILPYFAFIQNAPDVRVWHKYSEDFVRFLIWAPARKHFKSKETFYTALRSYRENSPAQHQKFEPLHKGTVTRILSRMSHFSETLRQKRLIDEVWFFEKPARDRNKDTPLLRSVTPEEVLKFAKSCKDRRISLLALLGYFGSLRPQETFALTNKDVLSSDEALLKCQTLTKFSQHGQDQFRLSEDSRQKELGTKLGLSISKQDCRKLGEKMPLPKSGTKRYVGIWHKQAALAISTIVAGMEDNNPEIDCFRLLMDHDQKIYHHDSFYKIWRNNGMKGVTLKDLRRASGYYLGRELMVPFAVLQDHFKHRDVRTTADYTRAPKVEVTQSTKRNLLDVV